MPKLLTSCSYADPGTSSWGFRERGLHSLHIDAYENNCLSSSLSKSKTLRLLFSSDTSCAHEDCSCFAASGERLPWALQVKPICLVRPRCMRCRCAPYGSSILGVVWFTSALSRVGRPSEHKNPPKPRAAQQTFHLSTILVFTRLLCIGPRSCILTGRALQALPQLPKQAATPNATGFFLPLSTQAVLCCWRGQQRLRVGVQVLQT